MCHSCVVPTLVVANVRSMALSLFAFMSCLVASPLFSSSKFWSLMNSISSCEFLSL